MSRNPHVGLRRPNFGTFLSESSERKAQRKFRASGCVNANGFIFSSSEKQLAVSLDSNIFVSSPNRFRGEAPMQNDSGCDRARNYFLRV
jgi:hypothetical protein